jgi:hypothetical protein
MKIHATTYDMSGNCSVILHSAVPAGNNAIGNSWKNTLIAAGRNKTSMVEGTDLGQITTAEKASIVAGDVIEIPGTIPTSVIAQGAAAIGVFADVLIVSAKAKIAQELNYYGWTSAT